MSGLTEFRFFIQFLPWEYIHRMQTHYLRSIPIGLIYLSWLELLWVVLYKVIIVFTKILKHNHPHCRQVLRRLGYRLARDYHS
jgi:hypothetical protein